MTKALSILAIIGVFFAIYVVYGQNYTPAQNMPLYMPDTPAVLPPSGKLATQPTPPTARTTWTYEQLLANGGNYECTFAGGIPTAMRTGTAYFAGARMRHNNTLTLIYMGETTVQKYHQVYTETDSYTWRTVPPHGETETGTRDKRDFAREQFMQAGVPIMYHCKPWKVDVSVFTPPSDIEFREFPDKIIEGPLF